MDYKALGMDGTSITHATNLFVKPNWKNLFHQFGEPWRYLMFNLCLFSSLHSFFYLLLVAWLILNTATVSNDLLVCYIYITYIYIMFLSEWYYIMINVKSREKLIEINIFCFGFFIINFVNESLNALNKSPTY